MEALGARRDTGGGAIRARAAPEFSISRVPWAIVITHNGGAEDVFEDVASYKEIRETLALLKILALGNRQVAQGKVKPIADVVKRIRERTAG